MPPIKREEKDDPPVLVPDFLDSVNINLIAFWRYFVAGATQTDTTRALAFVAIVFVAAAAEAAVGLALIISVYRRRQTVIPEDMNILKG